jgi:hypothetical protein
VSISFYDSYIFDELNLFKINLIDDWLVESSDLSISNFYDKNKKRLIEFNNFIARVISKQDDK